MDECWTASLDDTLPRWLLDTVPDRLLAPEWWRMDGHHEAVFALDIERSVAARRPLVEEAY